MMQVYGVLVDIDPSFAEDCYHFTHMNPKVWIALNQSNVPCEYGVGLQNERSGFGSFRLYPCLKYLTHMSLSIKKY